MTSMTAAARFAVLGVVRHAAHHLADYWADHQATRKGQPGTEGVKACTAHVLSYSLVSATAVLAANRVFRLGCTPRGVLAGELLSAITHYAADRREHALLFPAARRFGKTGFLERGGAPLLDQAWHHNANMLASAVTALDAPGGESA